MSDDRARSFFDRHYYLLRRLHSLSGIVPIGAFLLPHLTTNSAIVWGRLNPHIDDHVQAGVAAHGGVETFQHEVDFIHNLPFLVLIEVFVLWLPIAFHAGLGVYYALSGRSNVNRYGYQDNWRYTLQRLTGYVGIVYIFLHVASLRWGWTFGGLLPAFDPAAASSSTAVHLQHNPLIPLLYLVGVLALVFHFANGLWTAAITWGLTISVPAQRRWGWVCAAVGIVLATMSVMAIAGFLTLDVEQARQIEQLMGAAAAPADLAGAAASPAPAGANG